MGRRRKKGKHSHSKKNANNQQVSEKIINEKINENHFDSEDEARKKHKCKKNDFEHLTILDGLLILLLLKETGYLDEEPYFDETNYDKTNYDKTHYDKTHYDKSNYDKTHYDKSNYDKTHYNKTHENKTYDNKVYDNKTYDNKTQDEAYKDEYKEFGEKTDSLADGKGHFDFDAFEEDSIDQQ